jgi:hypothetical protein
MFAFSPWRLTPAHSRAVAGFVATGPRPRLEQLRPLHQETDRLLDLRESGIGGGRPGYPDAVDAAPDCRQVPPYRFADPAPDAVAPDRTADLLPDHDTEADIARGTR